MTRRKLAPDTPGVVTAVVPNGITSPTVAPALVVPGNSTSGGGQFQWHEVGRHPAIELHIVRCPGAVWQYFAKHHYMSAKWLPGSASILAFYRARPVCFSCSLRVMAKQPSTRVARTVVLPDYQGVGIGVAVTDTYAAAIKARGHLVYGTAAHPIIVHHFDKVPLWEMRKEPSLATHKNTRARGPEGKGSHWQPMPPRLTATFRYVGPALPLSEARKLVDFP